MIRTRTQGVVFPSFYLYSYPSPSSYSHTKEKTHSFSTKISHSLSYQAHIYMYAFFSLTIKGQAKTKDMLRSRPLLPT